MTTLSGERKRKWHSVVQESFFFRMGN